MMPKPFKYALCHQNELTAEDFNALESLNLDLQTAHPKRQASFLCARKALQKLVPQEKLGKLQLNEFHFLENFPRLVFSLAHTRELAIAVMVELKDYRSIGVDLEFLDREVKIGSERHFINEHDDRTLSDLELWCSKEAAFKAVSFLYSKNLVLKDLWIQNKSFGHVEDATKVLGDIESFNLENMLITVALLH